MSAVSVALTAVVQAKQLLAVWCAILGLKIYRNTDIYMSIEVNNAAEAEAGRSETN